MENNYGSIPSDDKPPPQGIQIKEELRKESASPDNMKTVSYFTIFAEVQIAKSFFIYPETYQDRAQRY